MKKSYIITFGIILIIFVILMINLIVLKSNSKTEQKTETKLSKIEQTENNIQTITTSAKEEDKEEIYIIKDKDGYIAVYIIDENGKEILRNTTKIVTRYLPDIDKMKLKEGIKVNSKEELNKTLEDYE